MPIPAYIVAAQGLSQDSRTHRLTFFNVVERLSLFARLNSSGELSEADLNKPENKDLRESQSFSGSLVATWIVEQPDRGQEFDCQFVMVSPERSEMVLDLPRITIKHDSKPFYRLTLGMNGLPVMTTPGIWMLELRMRRADQQNDWVSQRFPVLVEMDAETQSALKQADKSLPHVIAHEPM